MSKRRQRTCNCSKPFERSASKLVELKYKDINWHLIFANLQVDVGCYLTGNLRISRKRFAFFYWIRRPKQLSTGCNVWWFCFWMNKNANKKIKEIKANYLDTNYIYITYAFKISAVSCKLACFALTSTNDLSTINVSPALWYISVRLDAMSAKHLIASFCLILEHRIDLKLNL